MAGVQAEGCAPFVQAIDQGWTPKDALSRRWPKIDTIAGAIAAGSGLKDLGAARRRLGRIESIPLDRDALASRAQRH
jgi:hypothetical protein